MSSLKYLIPLLLSLATVPAFVHAGPDGLDLRSSTNVRMEMIFACGGDDAMCLKARDDRAEIDRNPEYDVRNIITSNVMIYQDGFRATKIGTETNAEYFENILYENIFVVKAGSANTLYLTDTATVRNVLYKNFYVESGGGNFGVGTQAFAGRTPTGHAEAITVSNLVTDGSLSFYGYSPSTATTDSGAINYRDRSSGTLYTDPSVITGPNATNITLTTNPVIAKEMEFPIEGSRHLLPGTVKVRARVFHETGQPMTVAFFNHGVSIGSVSTYPYEIDWAAPEGEHSLIFTVTDGVHSDQLYAPRRFEVRSEPVFTSVQILPGSLDIGTGLSRQFQARALDQYGDILDTQPTAWSWSVSGGGSVDATGTVTAGMTEGGPHTVSAEATLGGTTLSGTAEFTVTNTLTITNLFVASGDPYVWDTLHSGDLIYVDRDFTFGGIPEEYVGKFYLRNANDDKNRSGTVASFQVNLPVILFIAVTSDFDTSQPWFDGFSDTGTFIQSKRVYSKSIDPGIIALGRNGTPNMYHVVLNYPLTANVDPVADFSAPVTSGPPPLTVEFDASASSDADGAIVRYDWDFGDGTTLADGGPTPSHTYQNLGSYSVSLTVTDNVGVSDTLERTDYIFVGNQSPVASFDFVPDNPEVAQTVSFNASASMDPDGTIEGYRWDFGDGTVLDLGSTGKAPTHSYAAGGAYTVSLTVTDNNGDTDEVSQYLFVGNQPPVAALASDSSTGLAPLTVQFDASASSDPNADPLSFDWDFGDGTSLANGSAIQSHPFTEAGNYTTTMTVSDGEFSDQASIGITVVTPGTSNLIYHFDFDANDGNGTTVNDVSGFGAAADASTFAGFPAAPADLFTLFGDSGSYGGDFTPTRSHMNFDAAKFNDQIAGGTNAFTFVWTMQLQGFGSGGDERDRSILEDTNTNANLRIGGNASDNASTFSPRIQVGSSDVITAPIDASAPILIAVTYSSGDDTVSLYTGSSYGELALHDSIALGSSGISQLGGLRVGDSSSRDPDMLIDDIRLYDDVLSLPELRAIGSPPSLDVPPVAVISEDGADWLISVPSMSGFAYQLRTHTDLSLPSSQWSPVGTTLAGEDGTTLEFRYPKGDPAVPSKKFFIIEITSE